MTGPPSSVELVKLAEDDLKQAGAVTELVLAPQPGASGLQVSVELAEEQAPESEQT